MMASFAAVGRLARDEYGVRAALHPHAACYVEFDDEIEAAMKELDPDLVGCASTPATRPMPASTRPRWSSAMTIASSMCISRISIPPCAGR